METVTVSKFVAENKIRIINEAIDERPDGLMGEEDNGPRPAHHWKSTLCMGTKRMTVYFTQGFSIQYQPSVDDVLWSLKSDTSCPDVFEDFCSELGYDVDSRKAEKIFKAVRHISNRLHKFMGDKFEALMAAEEDN
jgi:hypothetical protein